MDRNPYNPGGMPQVFVGREVERQQLRDKLGRVSTFGEMMGPLTLVTAPRGLGKTSLLADLADLASENGFIVAWVTGLKRKPFVAKLLTGVTRALQQADATTRASAKRNLEEVGVQLNTGVLKVSAKVGPKPGVAMGVDPGDVDQVEDFLFEASNLVKQRQGAGLLILIDELHAPLEPLNGRDSRQDPKALEDAAVLLNVIQNMERQKERFPLGIIGAGLPQTKPLLMQAATFAERAHEIVLPMLDYNASRALLTEPARMASVNWAEDALEEALRLGRGYPQSLQIIGAAAWNAANPGAGSEITLEHIKASAPSVSRDLESMFTARWNLATPLERRFLQAMANHADENVPRAMVAQELGFSTASLSMARASLIDKGIIEAATYGEVRFTIPGFGQFVRGQAPQ